MLVLCSNGLAEGEPAARGIPVPGPDHPGNVFLAGESVIVRLPGKLSEFATQWRAVDDRGNVVANGAVDRRAGCLTLGEAGIGWYRVEFLDAQSVPLQWTTAAVLGKLAAPIPADSPVCLDIALSWMAKDRPEKRPRMVQLAALAGVNMVRDRLRWRDIEPGLGDFVDDSVYDRSAGLQAQAGLEVLQVFHDTPAWAMESESERGRFPGDLRHVYRLCKAMAQRFHGRVQAWEPWNEANVSNFGGHSVDAMCSLQKAAYLGFKAGDPSVIVGWNPIGGINSAILSQGILENTTWPYFETYNLHSYDWPHDYERLWEHARRAASGRPMWVTECDRGIAADPGSEWGDLEPEDALRKAEFIAQSYAHSLHAGAVRHFHFILGHYMEEHGECPIQFGLLRKDLTPRPSYVALAAVGRLLAGAECLGRWPFAEQPNAYVYAFRARPGGIERDVLVAWTEAPFDWPGRGHAAVPWSLPEGVHVVEVFDYLGRSLGRTVSERLRSAPIFVLLPAGESQKLPLTPKAGERLLPEGVVPTRPGSATPGAEPAKSAPPHLEGPPRVVLQLQTPGLPLVKQVNGWTQEHDRVFPAGQAIELVLCTYNFGDAAVRGRVSLAAPPDGWRFDPEEWAVEVEALGRHQQTVMLRIPHAADSQAGEHWIRYRAACHQAGSAVLAVRVRVQ